MQRKTFKSKLFNRKINIDNVDYFSLLYAEALYRIRILDDLKCPCNFCRGDRIDLERTIRSLIKDEHIKENPKPINFTGIGDCGRKLGPVA